MTAARDIRFVVRLAALAALAAAALALVPTADASYILARNASGVSLKTNAKGDMALITYRDSRGLHRVLAWGAVNARPKPTRSVAQIAFKLDYSGGYGKFGRPIWKTFRDYSRAYDGPSLPFVAVAKKARNGSYWVLQRWQRMLPNYGVRPWKASQRVWELRLSHFTGDPGQLQIWLDWAYSGRFHNLFGLYTYKGNPYYGFGSTAYGNPTDGYGRLDLRRHLQLGVRRGLEARELVPHASPARKLLLRLLPAHPAALLPGQRQAAGGRRGEVPRDHGRPRRRAGRHVVGSRSRRLRLVEPGACPARAGHERAAPVADRVRRRRQVHL